MPLEIHLTNTKRCKNLKYDRNPGKWVLIWKYSARSRAIQWVLTWIGSDDIHNLLHSCALDESCIERVNVHYCFYIVRRADQLVGKNNRQFLWFSYVNLLVTYAIHFLSIQYWYNVISLTETDYVSLKHKSLLYQLLCCRWLSWPVQNEAKKLKMAKTLAHGYSSERTKQELSNEYQHDRV